MTAERSAWSPLKNTLFRSLWIATIVSNIGTWMQDVGAGWLMTSLSSSPSMVALVEAADSFPLMLLALPAGALADIVDRRRLLIAIQTYLLIVAGALGILTLLDMGAFPRARMNPNGGSVALGHPFGATGARILSQTVKELSTQPAARRAIVSICADGGQGSVVLLEASAFGKA